MIGNINLSYALTAAAVTMVMGIFAASTRSPTFQGNSFTEFVPYEQPDLHLSAQELLEL